jgi:hypothetical protein
MLPDRFDESDPMDDESAAAGVAGTRERRRLVGMANGKANDEAGTTAR